MRLTTHNGPLGPNGQIFPNIWAAVAIECEKIRAELDAKRVRVEVSAPLSMWEAAE